MCKVSDQIKLCSCGDKPVESLESHWVISKLKENCYRIGEVVMNDISNESQHYNWELLLTLLNNNELFDFNYLPEDKDELKIYITIDKINFKYIHYTFIFKNGKWTNGEMEWMNIEAAREVNYGYATHKEGRIENAI